LLLRLFKTVVNGRWKNSVARCPDPLKNLRHTALEELSRLLTATVPKRVSDQLILLGDQDGSQQVGVKWPQRPTEPHIEEIGEIRVGNIVVIGWVRAKQAQSTIRNFLCRQLADFGMCGGRKKCDRFRNPFYTAFPVASGVAEDVRFRIIPS